MTRIVTVELFGADEAMRSSRCASTLIQPWRRRALLESPGQGRRHDAMPEGVLVLQRSLAEVAFARR
jgi:hypothetical protein